MASMKWERLKSELGVLQYLQRAKVPEGWLIVVVAGGATGGITFYPDPKHEWNGDTLSEVGTADE